MLVVLNSECQDLRIMNTAGDRKINELRAEMQLFKSSMDKELSKLETDVNIFFFIVRFAISKC
jgi:hypothetical protein